MGFLDFFKKGADSPKPASTATVSTEELRRQLFESIDRNHLVEFEHLCQDNEAHVMRSFASWKKAPEDVQKDKDLMRKYAYSLMVIASYFQKQLNKGELMTMLTGIDDTEYSRKWQEQLGQCKMLMQQQLKFAEAIPVLEECLDLASGVSGAGVDRFLPLTLGFLGECYFQQQDMVKASDYIERALQCTQMQGDYEATVAYLSNLFEIHRYLGDAKKAEENATTIAEKAFDRGELITASSWRHHARAVKAGEPLFRIVLRIGDELFEVDEIPKVHGEKVEFIFVRNRLELVLCSQKCYEGRELTNEGKYIEALAIFEVARTLDKYSPQPYYMAGNIKLASRNYAEAIEDLNKVEELCPGFETSRADLWLAHQLLEKKMEHDACTVAYEANNDDVPAEDRIKICSNMAKKYPQFGEAYWRQGKLLADLQRNDEALEVFKQGMEITGENDVRSRLLRDAAILSKDEDEKRKLFAESIALEKGNVLAQAMSRYMLRQLESE